ncbi:DUF3352 domain-containing protein [bacterium]|jgi:hypothetical protein|nr:DUF3352 domain-containing protein [bacterium]MBT4251366.1 DUF3352 domain-containing protein [bacterium]MBT4598253.1 DUF3352 domain-containing protein [bacterium]MBT6754086.1 DUF3352 domain-containing protein [bacterium]MBT7037906.1 DUF3352 domain-containing protein [bacterium]
MELRKRETVKNINFNGKGEKIKNGVFNDEKKDEKNRLGKDVEFTSAGLAEKEKKGVSVSNTPDSSIAIANGSPLEDHEKNAKVAKIKKILIGGGFLLTILLVVGGYFGFEARDVYLAKVPLEEILKGDAEVVFNINSNADFEQYKYLDDNLRKFPGYKWLEKELDDVGEGKTMSQAFQDELAAHNLSFNDDIKKVIGDKTIAVIPSVTSLTNELQKFALNTGKNAKNSLRKRELEGKIVNANEAWISGDMTEVGRVKVLGLTSDFYAQGSSMEQKQPEPVDFLIGASIKSLKEAKRVLNKIKKDTTNYQVAEVKFEGYTYFKVTRKIENEEEVNEMLSSVKDTYHALVGHNWIMATKESDLKEMISARRANHVLSKITFWKKNESAMTSLANDGNYQLIEKDLAFNSQNGLISAYLKVDYTSLMSSSSPEDTAYKPKKFFKSQESDLLLGALFRVTPSGVVIRTSSNQINLVGVNNTPIETGLIQKMPKHFADRWTDVYFETSKVKSLYYNFKKNNLTQDGIDAVNEAREAVRDSFGVNFDMESDFIDHFNGDIAFGVFTGNRQAPHAAMVVEVDDEVAMLESVRKIVEITKIIQLMPYQMMMGASSPISAQSNSSNEQDIMRPSANSLTMPKETQEMYAKKIKEIQDSSLIEVQTDPGPSYVYDIPGVPGISLTCSFFDGKMILGTDQNVVVSLQKEFGNGNATKLIKADEFERIVKNIYPQGYSKSLITPLGVWNGFSYYMEQIASAMGTGMDQEEREVVSAIGTVFRTINSISSIQTISPASEEKSRSKSSLYIDIKEVDAEEKERAEEILMKMRY